MYNLIKTLCSRCKDYFENSEKSCISSSVDVQEKLSLMLKPSTLIEIKITRQVKKFCKISKNRFWMLYYRISETKIHFSCEQCNKSNLCQEYILDRIMKYIKVFDTEKESKVFEQVKENLTNSHKQLELDANAREVVTHYTTKIQNEYREKIFDFEMGSILLENALLQREEIGRLIEKRLQRYKIYQAPIVLRDLVFESLGEDKAIKEPILIELLHKEKFLNYIREIIKSRFLDFLRSKQARDETLQESVETETPPQYQNESSDKIKPLLDKLPNEQKIIYKLKYGISLDNREFLSATYKINQLESPLIDKLTPDEKFYIKFSLHYEIDDDSAHFSMIDVKKTKASISEKILVYREKLQSQSYIEKREEILIKLVYSEPLSAKEIGGILGLTSKQIGKKVENSKKRLQKLEHIL